jgi:hypothetical protein
LRKLLYKIFIILCNIINYMKLKYLFVFESYTIVKIIEPTNNLDVCEEDSNNSQINQQIDNIIHTISQ